MKTLEGKVALVTGASRGIGRAVSGRLAAEGAAMVLNDHAAATSDLEEATEFVAGYGGEVEIMDADVAHAGAVEQMVERAIERFGRIDILVNNAGIARPGPIHTLSEEDWDLTVDVNLKGQFLLSRAVVPGMRERRQGSIVNIASELGLVGQPDLAPYCASKAGVIGLTKALARELAPFSIRVNCVAPGPTDTALLGDAERTAKFLETIPLRRLGTPADIASSVWFLLSSEAAWITGQVLSPNGGVVI